ncbi:MAG: NAD(P)-dependent alcohol dehydrogenase [Actinomycetota bacterium]|nr:NAD(P)-dependent alcohol dehydrogenase [Actinomycetota bacterium]MDA8209627.1 NAD(P)-dependent alcohol dehydrogenase [Actinomycetota bacterium]
MLALRLKSWKSEAVLEEVPEPQLPPAGAIIRVLGAGACHSDLHLMHDFEADPMGWGPPFTLGHENAGEIVALGREAFGLEVGQKVAVYGPWGCGHCRRCAIGEETYCENAARIGAAGGGLGLDGGMAPLMAVPDTRLLIPLGDLDPVEAAPLTDAGLTPYHAVKRSLHKLIPGSAAVVIGAGGLGHMAVQILKAVSPAKVIVVDTRAEALEFARSLGADETLIMGDDTSARITELTGGQGAEAVIDLVGADSTITLGMRVARTRGDLSLVGLAGGSAPFSFFSSRYEVEMASTYWGTRAELMEVISLAQGGLIRSHIQRVKLEDAIGVYRLMREGKLEGRAVVTPNA